MKRAFVVQHEVIYVLGETSGRKQDVFRSTIGIHASPPHRSGSGRLGQVQYLLLHIPPEAFSWETSGFHRGGGNEDFDATPMRAEVFAGMGNFFFNLYNPTPQLNCNVSCSTLTFSIARA